jgi:hypothetical protein
MGRERKDDEDPSLAYWSVDNSKADVVLQDGLVPAKTLHA